MSDVQDAAFEKMRRLKVGALFMEMGTGKTKVALDLMAHRLPRVDVFIWICPCALKGEIERERTKWHPELPLDVVGCESIGASDRIYGELLGRMDGKRCFVVVDESLKIKNIGAKRTQRILEVGRRAQFRLILNGTPISNNVMDLWSQMEFLDPRILDTDYRSFEWLYAVTKDIRNAYGKLLCRKVVGQRNEAHLMSKIEPYVFDARLYLDVQRGYERDGYHVDESEYAAEVYRLLTEYSDLAPEMSTFALMAKMQRWYCRKGADTVRSVIERIRNREPDAQVIVFVKYVGSIPLDVPCIHGGIAKDQQDDIIRRFTSGELRTLYITYGVGSYGLNLQSAHHIVFAEHTWDYSQRVQAEARIYRMGQRHPCHYYDIVADTPLEGKIIDALKSKQGFAQTLKDAIRSASDVKRNVAELLGNKLLTQKDGM